MPKKPQLNPRKEPTQGRAKATVEVIVEAAAQVLSKLEFDAATTNRIAEIAGTSIGTLYQYFPNKEALGSAIIDQSVKRHSDMFRKVVADHENESIEKVVKAGAETIGRMYTGNRLLLKTIGALIPKLDRLPTVIEARREAVRIFADELVRRHDEIQIKDPARAAFLVINACMGVIQTAIFDETSGITSANAGDELYKVAWGTLQMCAGLSHN